MNSNSSLKGELSAALRDKIGTITFTKKDGTERVMKCTLDSSAMDGWTPSETSGRVVPDHLLPVWDIENNGWRSINIDTISKVELDA